MALLRIRRTTSVESVARFSCCSCQKGDARRAERALLLLRADAAPDDEAGASASTGMGCAGVGAGAGAAAGTGSGESGLSCSSRVGDIARRFLRSLWKKGRDKVPSRRAPVAWVDSLLRVFEEPRNIRSCTDQNGRSLVRRTGLATALGVDMPRRWVPSDVDKSEGGCAREKGKRRLGVSPAGQCGVECS